MLPNPGTFESQSESQVHIAQPRPGLSRGWGEMQEMERAGDGVSQDINSRADAGFHVVDLYGSRSLPQEPQTV